ncbi:hypothetical protein Taro_043516 [Colocasia esculenta]|uniref:Cytochrome P450 n=1 Tax=Colocasia esculenta TaxID=4460 RepID=A0A843WJM9_COLES|nr:hypothetical protein [Colocasia esculenta]
MRLAGSSNIILGYAEILFCIACFVFLVLFRRSGGRGAAAPTNWPFLGMLPGFLWHHQDFHDWATKVLRESGCTFLFKGPWFTGMEILGTADPANVNHIFNTNFANYPKGEQFLEIFDIFGDGIFNADDEAWKSQRRAAHALVSDPRFRRSVARTVRRKAEVGLVPLLDRAAAEGSAVDLQDAFLRFTFDTTCFLVLGVDPGCLSHSLPNVPFATAMDEVEEVIFFRHTVPRCWWKLLRRLRVGQEKKMTHAWDAIDDFIAKQIARKKEELRNVRAERRENDENMAGDLLTSYLVQRPEVGDDVNVESHKFLRDTTLNLMLAGRDANAATLTWVCWVVSQHPKVERRIVDELSAIVSDMPESRRLQKPFIFENEDLASAVYLEATILETLRLYPPIPFEHKGAANPDVLPSGHRVSTKTKILFSLYTMGRMEGIWGKDCCEFRPERWISERGRLKHEPTYKFFAFSSGPRSCLGREMALTQIRVAAAAAIYNFRIRAVKGQNMGLKHSIVLYLEHGLKITVENREI